MNKCIEFVDDDSKICRYFREYATYRGYACHCYQDAESALKGIVRNREGVWAICVDLTLPGSLLQGPELITELREAHRAELPDEAIREIDALSDHIELCVQIVDNYNRIKGPPFAEVDVVSVANARLKDLRTDADRKRLSLSAALPPSCVVWAHESKLANVIHNLVDNAIKYTSEGGSVSLSVGWEKDNFVITVTDTGCGVPAEYRERVFDPAFRAPGTAKVEGQGLELSFVRSIVRFHGGTCRCDSNLGFGSTFTVKLPVERVVR